MTKFSVGDKVYWSSQAQGAHTTKTGTVVEILPKGHPPDTKKYPQLRGCGYGRDHETYIVVVEIPGKRGGTKREYWPRTSALKPVEVG